MATNKIFGIDRITLLSTFAGIIILSVSIGLSSYFNPQRIKNNLDNHKTNVTKDMEELCGNIRYALSQDKQSNGINNVMNYNLQKLHGQCYMLIGPPGEKVKKPIELVKMTGCSGDNFVWEVKQDSSIFEFCPALTAE